MYYEVSRLTYHDEEAAFKLRKELIHPVVKRQKGCKSVQFFKSTDGSGEYLIVISWETKEDRDAWPDAEDHHMLKEKQWPLMKDKITTKQYELILD